MMKILYVILFLLSVSMVQGQGIQFFHGSFDEVMKKAEKEGKQIFVDVYTVWCGPCKQMTKQVFSDESVGKYYNDKFVCIKLDAEKEKSNGFFKKYQASGYPSLFWLTAKGDLIDMHTGVLSPKAFIDKAEALKDSKLAQERAIYKKRWDSGERSVELMDNYVFGYISKVEPDKFTGYCLDYLKSLDEKELKTAHTFKIVSCFDRNMKPGLPFDLKMKYWDDYARLQDYETFEENQYRWIVRGANVKGMKSEKEYQEHLKLVRNATFPGKEMYLACIDAEAVLRGDVNKGILAAESVLARYGKEYPYLYRQFAYSFVNCGYFSPRNTDKIYVDKVLMICEQAYELTPSQETVVYVAAAHAKMGDYKTAYATLGALPFLPRPVLSNALYSKLGLFRRPETEYSKTTECAEMKKKVEKLIQERKPAVVR